MSRPKTHTHTTNLSYYFTIFFSCFLCRQINFNNFFPGKTPKIRWFHLLRGESAVFFFLLHDSKLIVAEFWTNKIFEDGFREKVNFTKTT